MKREEIEPEIERCIKYVRSALTDLDILAVSIKHEPMVFPLDALARIGMAGTMLTLVYDLSVTALDFQRKTAAPAAKRERKTNHE